MESQGTPGSIQTTAATYERIKDQFEFHRRGIVEVKGKGEMLTYLLLGPLPASAASPSPLAA